MVQTLRMALTVMVLLLVGATARAESGEGSQIPEHTCDKATVKAIYAEKNQDLIDAIEKRFVDGEAKGTDERFCKWLEDRYDGRTNAAYDCKCGRVEPASDDLDRSGLEGPVRERVRTMSSGGFDWGNMLASFLGSAAGGYFGSRAGSRSAFDSYRRDYFRPPYWNQGPAIQPFPGGGGVAQYPQLQIAPYRGVQPWQQQYAGGIQPFQYQQQFGGAPPAVAPILPQYSVMSSVQTPQYRLLGGG